MPQMSGTWDLGRRELGLRKLTLDYFRAADTLSISSPFLKSSMENQISVPTRFILMPITSPLIYPIISESVRSVGSPGLASPFQGGRGRTTEVTQWPERTLHSSDGFKPGPCASCSFHVSQPPLPETATMPLTGPICRGVGWHHVAPSISASFPSHL